MKFANPAWLWGLLLLPVLLWALARYQALRLKKWGQFARPEVWGKIAPEFDPQARPRKDQVWVAALAFLLLALARPQWGRIEETVRAAGLDVMVVLDVSQSMWVEDIVPSRLKKAQHMVRSLLERLQGDRLGLVAFAGSSFLACPLTTDLGYVGETLSILSPRLIQNQGSDLGIALETATRALQRGGEEAAVPQGTASASKAVILFSDGEDHEPGALEQARALKAAGIRLYVVGLGSEKGGPIPLRDDFGRLQGFKGDASGKQVTSTFNPKHLSQVAQEADGRYFAASMAETEVDEVVSDLGRLTRGDYAERRIVTYQDRYQLPLFIAVVLFLLELSLPARRVERRGLELSLKSVRLTRSLKS